jgi:hypothetical protein
MTRLRDWWDEPLSPRAQRRIAAGLSIVLLLFALVLLLAPSSAPPRRQARPAPTFDPPSARVPTPVPTVTARHDSEPGPARQPGVERAARVFLNRYLAWQYGHDDVLHGVPATRALLRTFAAQHPRVPAAARRLHVTFHARQAGARAVVANVTAGRDVFTISLALRRVHGQWVVSAMSV